MGCSSSKELPLGQSDFGQENDLPSIQLPLPSPSEYQQPIERETQGEDNGIGETDMQGSGVPFANSANADLAYVNLERGDVEDADEKIQNSSGHHAMPPSDLSNSISTTDLNIAGASEGVESQPSRASSVVSISQYCGESSPVIVEDPQITFMKSFYSTQFSNSQNKDKLLEELVEGLNAVAESRDWEAVSPVLLKLYSIVFFEKTPYGSRCLPLPSSASSALRSDEWLRLHRAALLHPLPFPRGWRLQSSVRPNAAVFLRQQS